MQNYIFFDSLTGSYFLRTVLLGADARREQEEGALERENKRY